MSSAYATTHTPTFAHRCQVLAMDLLDWEADKPALNIAPATIQAAGAGDPAALLDVVCALLDGFTAEEDANERERELTAMLRRLSTDTNLPAWSLN